MKSEKIISLLLCFCFFSLTSCKKEEASIGPENGTMIDIDGNVYNTIKIGDQTWMAENLRTTRYRNGDAVHEIADHEQWRIHTDGARCSYNNNDSLSDIYGYLYNWYTINDERNIAPEGWHVATEEEWLKLMTVLGGRELAGGRMKEEGNAHWKSEGYGTTNSSGFSAIPGGMRWADSAFVHLSLFSYWWSPTDIMSTEEAYCVRVDVTSTHCEMTHGHYKTCGMAIRCVRDND